MESKVREKIILVSLFIKIAWLGFKNRMFLFGFFTPLIIFSLLVKVAEAAPGVYCGKVVGIEFNVIQVKGDDGKVSVFWLGYRSRLDSRAPFFGDRVKIEYVKDPLGRNAVTRIAISR